MTHCIKPLCEEWKLSNKDSHYLKPCFLWNRQSVLYMNSVVDLQFSSSPFVSLNDSFSYLFLFHFLTLNMWFCRWDAHWRAGTVLSGDQLHTCCPSWRGWRNGAVCVHAVCLQDSSKQKKSLSVGDWCKILIYIHILNQNRV